MEILRARCTEVLWHELARDVVQVLRNRTPGRPEARRRAHVLARSLHLGLRHHDAAGALRIIDEALVDGEDPSSVAHLQRAQLRWATVTGHGAEAAGAPTEASDARTALGMITVGVSGVVTGPLEDAQRVLLRLRAMPDEVIELVPGGAALIELTEIMALANTGDVVATRQRLIETIARARDHAPETLGMWEYALGFSHLLSGGTKQAYELGQSAAAHLAWRDAAGLLPAAQALAGAGAQANGRTTEARKLFDAVPQAAAHDPKVVMLREWSHAWQAKTERRDEDAVHTLVNAARWTLAAQHTFFAGMLAHCAVRLGEIHGDTELDAVTILREADTIAGGALLDILVRHGEATLADDHVALDRIAADALELGMETMATDTWLTVLRSAHDASLPAAKERHLRSLIGRIRAETPTMALWAVRPN